MVEVSSLFTPAFSHVTSFVIHMHTIKDSPFTILWLYQSVNFLHIYSGIDNVAREPSSVVPVLYILFCIVIEFEISNCIV